MQITQENEELGFRVIYRKEDGYDSRRLAVLLYDKVSRAGDAAKALAGRTVRILRESDDQTEASPMCRIAVNDREIDVTVGGILAGEAAMRYFDDILSGGCIRSAEIGGDMITTGANVYAFRRQGDHRVMYYNILWDADLLHAPWERGMMEANIIREFAPEVVGLQECGKPRRLNLLGYDIASQMERVGYREAPVSDVKNSYHDINCTPLFYRESEVNFVEGAYHWYSVQTPADQIGRMDASSKSLTWGVFESKKNGERYIAVSTHMCTQVDEIRETQAKEAIRLFGELWERYHLPIILGGDFNSNHAGKGYRCFRDVGGYQSAPMLAEGYVSPEKTFHPYPEWDPALDLCMPTAGAVCNVPKSIDHILFPTKPEAMRIKIFGVAVNSYTLAASDHFPVFTDFTL